VCAAAVVVVAVVVIPRDPFLGNYFELDGSYAATIPGTAQPIFAGWIWNLLWLLGFSSLVILGLLTVLRRATRPEWSLNPSPNGEGRALVGAFSAVTAALALVAVLATDAPFYDRYLLALVPFAAALAIRAALDERVLAHRARAVATAGFVALSVVGLIFVDASTTFDGGKWQLARAVEHLGFAPATIDGGYEWFGYHQNDNTHQRPRIEGRSFWVTLFSERSTCVTLTFSTDQKASSYGSTVEPQLIRRLTVRSLVGITYRLAAVAGPQPCDPLTRRTG
jgi:hypothetical protein